MSDNPKCDWYGLSGDKYTFTVYDLPSKLNDGQDGNYIFCTLNEENAWVPLYIGQGDLGDRTKNPDHPECLSEKGASHVHAHLNKNEQSRLDEEGDLLEAYPQAYQPTGCNEREGG